MTGAPRRDTVDGTEPSAKSDNHLETRRERCSPSAFSSGMPRGDTEIRSGFLDSIRRKFGGRGRKETEALNPVSTIGYQGKTIEIVIEELEAARIQLLADVRRLPLSRKPGFSKTALAKRLEMAGIAYRHYPDLGMPRDLLRLRNDRDNAPILHQYEALLPELHEHVDDLTALARSERVCLLCFEADPAQCHRSVLANYIHARSGIAVRHLWAK